jgi:hypothetical protein
MAFCLLYFFVVSHHEQQLRAIIMFAGNYKCDQLLKQIMASVFEAISM